MRTPRRALAGALLPAALLLLPRSGAALAEDGPVTYTAGTAQLLLRGGAPTLDTFSLVSGVRDATAGTLVLEYRQPDGKGTLRILTPNVPGTHAAAPRPPRGAAVAYRNVHGRTGARAACTIAWSDVSATSVSGSYLCPKERLPKGSKARYAVTGTFTARVGEGGAVPDPVVLPIYPVGTSVEVDGQTLAVTGAADVGSACVGGKAKGADAGDCPAKQLPLAGAFRTLGLSACVADAGEPMRLKDRTGFSQILYTGVPDALVPVGLGVAVVDPSVTTTAMPRVLDPGSCLDGHLVTATAGPLVVWMPPAGAPPVGWTLDPVALPPTADGPGPDASNAPASPGPVATGGATYTAGAADILVDGASPFAADDLVLGEGSYVVNATGTTVLHLAYTSPGGTLTIDVPGPSGSFAWDPGQATANEGVGFAFGDAVMDAGLSGCQVEIAPTEAGGVAGAYVCMPPDGGSASGAFVANP